METIYNLVGDVCGRDFPVLAKLSKEKQTKLIDIIYEDVISGDNPTEITEQQLYDYVEEFIAKAVSVSVDDVVDFYNN